MNPSTVRHPRLGRRGTLRRAARRQSRHVRTSARGQHRALDCTVCGRAAAVSNGRHPVLRQTVPDLFEDLDLPFLVLEVFPREALEDFEEKPQVLLVLVGQIL